MRPELLRSLVTGSAVLGVALGTVLVGSVGAPVSAREARRDPAPVMRATNGERCTIVGTPGRDSLKGTAGRDVICALGGNDFVYGRGGDDVVDGGAGNDVVSGAGGRDVLIGGAGRDRISGGGGNDVVDGEDGHDDLRGGAGADQLQGGAEADLVTGDGGNDSVVGGGGDDHLDGGGGDDVVTGGAGDDELGGGAGTDDVDGNAGFNICDVPDLPSDQQVRCVTDMSRPVVESISVSRTTVDVSEQAQTVTVRARVTDDTGVKQVQIGTLAHLVSGTVRDGVWASDITVPRFIAPGPREVSVYATDRVGRGGSASRADAYVVTNTVVDREMPVLTSVTLSASSLDVRSASKSLTVTAHITDDLAGGSPVYLCPAHAFPTGTPAFRQAGGCEVMTRLSGSRTDGTWSGTLTVPKGAPSGTWNVEVWIDDAAGNFPDDYWLGPDAFAALEALPYPPDPRDRALPGGAGAFTVIGAPVDSHAPVLTSFSLSRPTVDTSLGAVRVTADVTGTDVEGVTSAFLFISGYPGYPDNPDWTDSLQVAWLDDFSLVRGTPKSGTWRGSFVVPGGMPDGTYFVQVVLRDAAHWESWVSPDSGWTTDAHLLDDTIAPTSAHFVVANSG